MKHNGGFPLIRSRSPAPGFHPPQLYPDSASSVKRAPRHPRVSIPQTLSEIPGPGFQPHQLRLGADLTAQSSGKPAGQRILLSGRVLDEDGKPVGNTLIEIWQANAAGRYHHAVDQHNAPLDPNFFGKGQLLTDDEGRYQFKTINPV